MSELTDVTSNTVVADQHFLKWNKQSFLTSASSDPISLISLYQYCYLSALNQPVLVYRSCLFCLWQLIFSICGYPYSKEMRQVKLKFSPYSVSIALCRLFIIHALSQTCLDSVALNHFVSLV